MNDPNEDGFVGADARALQTLHARLSERLEPASWLTLTTGAFYSHVDAGQERPFVSQLFGPQPTFISDETEQTSGFAQVSVTPVKDLNLVAGGRYDHFNQFGDVWTYRFRRQLSDFAARTRRCTRVSRPGSVRRAARTRFSGTTSGSNRRKIAAGTRAWSSVFGSSACDVGATYFHNRLSNVIGFNGLFETLNLGAARTQGVEAELEVRPLTDLSLSRQPTPISTRRKLRRPISVNCPGARLPRRPRQ